MNARNCRKCGKLFNYVSGPPICMACREALEEKFHEVKSYIWEHVQATIPEVAEAADEYVQAPKSKISESDSAVAEG